MRRIERPTFDQELIKHIRSAEVVDIDEIYEKASRAAVDIEKHPSCEIKNEDLVNIYIAWSNDKLLFADVLAYNDVDATLISELDFISCCIVEEIARRGLE